MSRPPFRPSLIRNPRRPETRAVLASQVRVRRFAPSCRRSIHRRAPIAWNAGQRLYPSFAYRRMVASGLVLQLRTVFRSLLKVVRLSSSGVTHVLRRSLVSTLFLIRPAYLLGDESVPSCFRLSRAGLPRYWTIICDWFPCLCNPARPVATPFPRSGITAVIVPRCCSRPRLPPPLTRNIWRKFSPRWWC